MVDRRFNAEIAKNNGVPEGICWLIIPLGAAYKAGVKKGDIITKFNGIEIKSFR